MKTFGPLALILFVILVLSVGCQRIQRPYAGKDTGNTGQPNYTVTPNPNISPAKN